MFEELFGGLEASLETEHPIGSFFSSKFSDLFISSTGIEIRLSSKMFLYLSHGFNAYPEVGRLKGQSGKGLKT